MDKAAELLIQIAGAAIKGEQISPDFADGLDNQTAEELFDIADKHDLAHLISGVLSKTKITIGDKELQQKIYNKHLEAVMRYERLNYEFNRICELLEQEKIEYLPLKGSVIRNMYPDPWMRTSCDIDILVREEDVDKASNALVEKLEYIFKMKGKRDVSLYSKTNIHLELHFTLLEGEEMEKSDKPLKKVWQYISKQEDGKYKCALTDDMFYYLHIAHMTKHFIHGGCGIKPFMDLWIINNKMFVNETTAEKLLTDGGLIEFENIASHLSKVWFEEKEHNNHTKIMQQYLLGAGVYGSSTNRVAIQQVKKGGRIKYAINRIWAPYKMLEFLYPSLKKHKWLYVPFQFRRWFGIIFDGRVKSSANELFVDGNNSQKDLKNAQTLLEYMGLK